jgi:O-antigen biosynthesis protein
MLYLPIEASPDEGATQSRDLDQNLGDQNVGHVRPSELGRRARQVFRRIVRRLRRLRYSRTIRTFAKQGAVDATWIAEQLGRDSQPLTPSEAATRYLIDGVRLELSPLPLFEPRWYDAEWNGGSSDPLLRYLRGQTSPSGNGAHPLIDALADAAAPTAGHHSHAALRLAAMPTGPIEPAAPDGPTASIEDVRARLRALNAALLQEAQWAAGRVRHRWSSAREREYIESLLGRAPESTGDEPVVSVVMPVLNRPEQVRAAIASVQAQTFAAWELLVVDDGSTDATPSVVATIAKSDDRVRLIRRDHVGVSSARNVGIEAARGRFTAFLDSDNTWRAQYLATILAAMTIDDLSAAYAVTREVGARGARYRVGRGDHDAFQVGNFVDINVLVLRTEVLREVGGFDVTLRRMVDYDLAWRISKRVPLVLVPFVGVEYDARPDAARISTTEAWGWDDVVRTRNTVDLTSAPASPTTQLTVVVPCREFAAAAATVHSLVQTDVDVVVVDCGSPPSQARLLHAVLPAWPNVRLVRTARDLHRAGAFDVGLGCATGHVTAMVDAGVELSEQDLVVLTEPLHNGSAVWTRPSDPDLGARVVAARTSDWRLVDGLDPVFILGREVDDGVRRLTAAVGPGREVRLPDARPAAPARVATPVVVADNEREFARRYLATGVGSRG